MLQINQPYAQFNDLDGQPLDAGYVYIGTVNQNPITNPITVYWDEAGTIVAAQPLRTVGGYIARDGSPARIYITQSGYSIIVRDSNQSIVYSELNGANIDGSLRNDLAESDGDSLVGHIANGASAVATTVQRALRNVSRVPVYLDSANSGAQNKAAVQAAMASMTRPGKLIFPDGIFNMSPDINLGNYTVGIEGGGKYATQLSISGGSKAFYSNSTPIEYFSMEKIGLFSSGTDYGLYAAQINHSLVRDCIFTGFDSEAIHLGGYSNDILFNDIFSNLGSGVSLNGTLNNTNIIGNKIYANSGIGVLLASTDSDAGLGINIKDNAIEQNAVAGIVAFNTKSLNIKENYFERNAVTGYSYTSPVAITIHADIHLLCNNTLDINISSAYANKSPSVCGNHTTPDGSAGVGSQILDGFIFTNYPDNLLVENNQVFDTSMIDSLVCLYQNRSYSLISTSLRLSGNSVDSVGYIGAFTAGTEHLNSTHLITIDSSQNFSNYADQNILAWSAISGATGSIARSGNFFNLLPSAQIADGDKLWGKTIDLTVYQELRGKYVWFGAWSNDQGSNTNAQLFINAESSRAATPSGGTALWTFQSTLQYIDVAATSLIYGIKKIGTGSALLFNNPILAVVGDPFNKFKTTVPILWSSTAAPTTGSWSVGDRVQNSTPTVGQPKAWSCTVAGTPGTWVSEGVL